jgi:hypothetical protein
MLLDILSRLITRRVTSNALIIRILIDTDIVEAQVGRHVFMDALILRRKVIRHTHVHDYSHGFQRDHALSNVAVWSDGAGVECPGLFIADEPGYVAFITGGVFGGVGLVFRSVVPAVVQIR